MPSGHPEGLPDLFLDRSLGRVQVPTLLRAAGLRVRTLAEEYGMPADEDVTDLDWLAHAGQHGWPVLLKDERVRYRAAEKEAVIAFKVQGFCLTSGNLKAAVMAERFLAVIDLIAISCREPGPFLFTLSDRGMRAVPF